MREKLAQAVALGIAGRHHPDFRFDGPSFRGQGGNGEEQATVDETEPVHGDYLVGYPGNSLSHSRSREYWKTAGDSAG
jgi:hypothetical protein